MQIHSIVLLLAILVGAGCGIEVSKAASEREDVTAPEYDAAGDMLRPQGYRHWVFVGASLGLRYPQDGEAEDEGPGSFHNVYIQPEAYAYFMVNRSTVSFRKRPSLRWRPTRREHGSRSPS